MYKIYAESFRSADHLWEIQRDARVILEGLFANEVLPDSRMDAAE